MQDKNPLGSDFAKFLNGLAGTIAGMSREAGDSARERTREWIAGLDFVSREEFEAVKEMAATAREEAEALKARVAELEKIVAAKPAKASGGAAKTGAAAKGAASKRAE